MDGLSGLIIKDRIRLIPPILQFRGKQHRSYLLRKTTHLLMLSMLEHKYKIFSIIFLCLFAGAYFAQAQEPLVGADVRVFMPAQGGTGTSTAPVGDIGKCLAISAVSPLAYTFSDCSG